MVRASRARIALDDAEAQERWRLASFEAIVELAAQDDWAAARIEERAELPYEWADATPSRRRELIEAWTAEAQPLSPKGATCGRCCRALCATT